MQHGPKDSKLPGQPKGTTNLLQHNNSKKEKQCLNEIAQLFAEKKAELTKKTSVYQMAGYCA